MKAAHISIKTEVHNEFDYLRASSKTKLLLLDPVSAFNSTDPSIALIDRLISLNARHVLHFSTP